MPLQSASSALLSLRSVSKAVEGYKPRSLPPVRDGRPADPVTRPFDLSNTPDADKPPAGAGMDDVKAKQWLGFAERAYKAGQARKSYRAWEFYESRAYVFGNPWTRWDARAGKFIDFRRRDTTAGRRWEEEDFLLGKMLDNNARVLRNSPDIGITPLDPNSQADVQGVHEARTVWSHYTDAWNWQHFLREVKQESAVGGPPLVEIGFDPSLECDLPRMNADGSMKGVYKSKSGDLFCRLIRWEEWWTDYTGDFMDSTGKILVPWVGTDRNVRLSDIQTYYDNGFAVESEKGVTGDGCVSSLLAAANGIFQPGQAQESSEWVRLKRIFIAPTPALEKDGFPNGMVMHWANNVFLAAYDMADGMPFCPVYHLKVGGDIDGRNYIGPMLPAQRGYNRMLSKAAEHADLPEYNVLAMKNTSFAPNSYKGTDAKVIDYSGGPPPAYQTKPQLSAVVVQLLQEYRGNIDTISGISNTADIAPSADAPAIQLRLENDVSRTKDQIENLYFFIKWACERVIRLAGKYKTGPQLWLMGDKDGPPGASAMALTALTQGAGVRVKISPDSAIPRLPAQQLKFAQSVMAAIAPDGSNLPAIIAMLKVSDEFGTDDMAEELTKALQEIQASKPDPAKAQAEQRAAEQKHAAEMAALQSHAEQEKSAIDLHSKEVMSAQEHKQKLEILAFERMHPSVSLSASADSAATVEIEKAAGYDGKPDPLPTPAGGTKPKAGK